MREATGISIRRACRLAGLSRTTFEHEPKVDPENQALTARMIELAQERRRFGYRRIHVLLRREGVQANHKRVHRLYRMAGLAVRRRRRRERVAVERQPLLLPGRPNEVWSMDFVMDRLEDGPAPEGAHCRRRFHQGGGRNCARSRHGKPPRGSYP